MFPHILKLVCAGSVPLHSSSNCAFKQDFVKGDTILYVEQHDKIESNMTCSASLANAQTNALQTADINPV